MLYSVDELIIVANIVTEPLQSVAKVNGLLWVLYDQSLRESAKDKRFCDKGNLARKVR